MHDSQEHVFTNEFDELSILISIDTGTSSTGMRVTILERNNIWDERMSISMDNPATK